MSENHSAAFEDPNEARVRYFVTLHPYLCQITIGTTYSLFVVVAVEV